MNVKIIFICMLIILLTGCTSANETIKTSLPATVTMQPSGSPSELPTPAVALPDIVSTIPTVVSVPTLGSDDAFEILRSYLKNEQPCQLPCWWGITPGKSTIFDVQKQLTSFSGIAKKTNYGQAGKSWVIENLSIDFVEKNSLIGIRSSYLSSVSAETILLMGIDSVSLPKNTEGRVYGDDSYNELLFAYTLPQILTNYGLPDQSFIAAEIHEAEPTAPDYIVIRLLYPDLGMFIRYTMPAETGEGIYNFCPSQSVFYFDLIPQEYGNNYKDLFEQIGSAEWSPAVIDMPFYKSVEEALGLSIEEFYRLITSSPNQCFESPINIWPEP